MDWNGITDMEHSAWDGLRFAAKMRLALACKRLIDSGELRRADIMAIGGISQPQASIDLRNIMDRAPGFMVYDKSRRCYVRDHANE